MTKDESFFDTYTSTGPGLSDFDYRILRSMLKPYNRLTEEFFGYWNETLQLLAKLFQTRNDILPIAGATRAAFDAMFGSIVEPGEKVLVLANGYWGSYVSEVVEGYEASPIIPEYSPNRPIDPEKVSAELDKNNDVKAVSVMHVETDTGIVNPVRQIGKVVKDMSDALYVVDCATSLGGMEVNVDEWGADSCFTATHKCLASPAGLALVTVSERAWEVMRTRRVPIRGHYTNLLMWKERWLDRVPGKIPPPIPTSTVHAIRNRLDRIFEVGPKETFKRHQIAARALRTGVLEMALSVFADCNECEGCDSPQKFCSDTSTTVKYPTGVSPEDVREITTHRYNMPIVPAPYRPDCFQLGTINDIQTTPRYILNLITVIGLSMSALGVSVDLDRAVKRAERALLKLQKH